MQPPVNSKRRYNSTRRQRQAEETRGRVVRVARELFLQDGFAATAVAAVAAAADVSVEMIYKSFGNKAGLVREICQEALAGSGTVHAEVRSDAMQATEADAQQIIRGWGRLTMEVAPRIAPLLLLLNDAAANDAEMANLKTEIDAQRLQRMTHNAQSLAAAGHLREGVSVDHAADVLWTYSSPELYLLLVLSRRWPLERYGAFVSEAMVAALLPGRS